MSASGSASEETEPRRIAGRYRLTEPLGSGAMGTVWAGYDEVLHRAVAIKELRVPPGVPEGEMVAMRERMMREARTLGGLSHPNVITLYDVVDVGGDPYVVMELLPSRNLSEVIGEQGRLGVSQAATVGLAVSSALQAAHRAGITHRDVKPGNVLVAHDGRIKLTDFGIARKRDDTTMTQTGLVLGSPAYIAPEVASGLPVTPAADLWGLGATLFAAVEARPPYDVEGDPVKTVTAVVHDEVPRVGQTGPLADVIGGLMAKDPERRLALADVKRRLRPLLDDPDDPLFPGSPDAFVPPPDTRAAPLVAAAGSVASPSVFTPPVPPPGGAAGNRVSYTVNPTSGTSAPRRWTTTNPDGSAPAPLAADPGPLPGSMSGSMSGPMSGAKPGSASGPMPGPPSADYGYPAPGPGRPSWQQSGPGPSHPTHPTAPRPAARPAPQRSGLSGALVVPVILAGLIALGLGAGAGWAGTRSLVGQSVTSTDVVSAARDESDRLSPWSDPTTGTGRLSFTLNVPTVWDQFRNSATPNAGPNPTVRWLSRDGSRELAVFKIAGSKAHPAQPADFASRVAADAPGTVVSQLPQFADPYQLGYQINRAGQQGRSERYSYVRLVRSGEDLWVVRLTVPADLAGEHTRSTFSTIAASFRP